MLGFVCVMKRKVGMTNFRKHEDTAKTRVMERQTNMGKIVLRIHKIYCQ